MKVYISCHHPDPANELAAILREAGHEVVSTWHTETGPRPDAADKHSWGLKADNNLAQITTADDLVVIASPEHLSRERCVPGGEFFEAGFAQAHPGMRVFTVGGVENGMLYASDVTHVANATELLQMLRAPS